jgi:hypothetical protein
MAMSEIEKGAVWRTLTVTTSGYFLWEVREVVGEPDSRQLYLFEATNDGGYVIIHCDHYWTLDSALNALEDDSPWYDIYIITGKPELSAREYKEWLTIKPEPSHEWDSLIPKDI